MTPTTETPALSSPDRLLLEALEPLARGEEWNYDLVQDGLRSASAAVRDAVAGNPRAAQTEVEWLKRAYGFLAACAGGDPDHTREFILGRIASLIELAAAAAPQMSGAELDSMLDQNREDGQTKLKFLQEIAASATGARRPSDMARHVPRRADSEDQGMSAASKHLKHLMLAGYLIRERSGREVYYRLTAAGHEAVLRHGSHKGEKPNLVPAATPGAAVEKLPELWPVLRGDAAVVGAGF